jgi:hypothetical protein
MSQSHDDVQGSPEVSDVQTTSSTPRIGNTVPIVRPRVNSCTVIHVKYEDSSDGGIEDDRTIRTALDKGDLRCPVEDVLKLIATVKARTRGAANSSKQSEPSQYSSIQFSSRADMSNDSLAWCVKLRLRVVI